MKNGATDSQTPSPESIDLLPDAWDRFERAVDRVSKSGPIHRKPKSDSTKGCMADKVSTEGRGNGEIGDEEGFCQKDDSKDSKNHHK